MHTFFLGVESAEAQQYLKEIEKATKQLKNLLSRGPGSRTPLKCVNNLEDAISQLKNSLRRETTLFSKSPNSVSTPQSSKSVRFFEGLVQSWLNAMLHSALMAKTDSALPYLVSFRKPVDIVNFVYRKYGSAKSVALCSIAVVVMCFFIVKKK